MQSTTTTPTTEATGRATTTMYVGAALSVLLAALTFVDQVAVDGITDALWDKYPDYTSGEIATDAGATAAALYVLAGLGLVCWLLLATATRRGWRRTRLTAAIVFGLALVASLSMAYAPMPGYLATAHWLPCVAGIVALVMLWAPKAKV